MSNSIFCSSHYSYSGLRILLALVLLGTRTVPWSPDPQPGQCCPLPVLSTADYRPPVFYSLLWHDCMAVYSQEADWTAFYHFSGLHPQSTHSLPGAWSETWRLPPPPFKPNQSVRLSLHTHPQRQVSISVSDGLCSYVCGSVSDSWQALKKSVYFIMNDECLCLADRHEVEWEIVGQSQKSQGNHPRSFFALCDTLSTHFYMTKIYL